MPIVEVERDGQTYEIDVQAGQDIGAAVADFESSLGASASPGYTPDPNDLPSLEDAAAPIENRHDKSFMEGLGDRIGVAGDFVKGTLRDLTGADVDEDGERTGLESAQRGAGLAGRTIVGAIPKTASGLADLGSMLINTADRGMQNVFGFDNPDLLPTGNVQNTDLLLNEIFPEPESFNERVVNLGGEALFTGGMGSAALAGRAPNLAKAGSVDEMLRAPLRAPQATTSLADDVGIAFAQRPVTSSAAEFGGGAGAQTGAELAEDAELGPVGRLLATLGGGLAGAITPQATASAASRLKAPVARMVEPITPGGAKDRAARTLQNEARNPDAAAQASREAPEGVTGARASEDTNLRRIERKVADDDPAFADEVDELRAGAEQRTIDEFSEGLTPGQDPVEWQRSVVSRAAPEGTQVTGTQPDEMVEEAFQAFRREYAEVEGFPVQTKVMQVEGGDVPVPELIDAAVGDPKVLARSDVRESVGDFVRALYDDVAERGTPITNQADETVVQFDSADLLDFRQTIRSEQRRLESAGRTNPEAAAQAKLLKNVDQALTDTLESQVPQSASDALRALDVRYSDFKTVEDAVLRGTPGDLTPQQLQQSIKMQAGSRGRVARGDTGELGDLAEQGRDVTTFLGKKGAQDQALQRTMRNMTPEQQQGARSDIVRDLVERSQKGSKDTGDLRLDGDKMLKAIEADDSTLRAAGFEAADINRLTQLSRRLRMIQSPDPRASTQMIDDHLGFITEGVVKLASLRSARRLREAANVGSAATFALPAFFNKWFSRLAQNVKVDSAERIIADAMQPTKEGRELFEALMTRGTAAEPKRLRAERILNAWAAQAASADAGDE